MGHLHDTTRHERASLGAGVGDDEPWRWRLAMAEALGRALDPERFGVVALYLIGSTKNGTARVGSDIDLLLHFRGSETQRAELLSWLDGWSLAIAAAHDLRFGAPPPRRPIGMLDVKLLQDEDLAARTSYAIKIGAVSDAARELPLGSISKAIAGA